MKILSVLAVLSTAAGQVAGSNITAETIWNDITNGLECVACDGLLTTLQLLAHAGNDVFSGTIAEICTISGIENPTVCEGSLNEQGPILAHVLRQMQIPSHTSQTFCTTIFGLCDYPAVREYNVTFASPRPANISRPAPSGQDPIKVVHFSDIHVDGSYTVGASYNCTYPICCVPYTQDLAPGNNSYPAGPFGNHLCDAPPSLEESMYQAIAQLVPDADFAIFTGDVVEGAVWIVNQTGNTFDINDAYGSRMQPYFKTLYGATGNHEAAPVNSFPPDTIETTISSQWVYDSLSSNWNYWIGSSAASFADKYGSYAYDHSPGLKIISFNSNFYYKQNFWLFEQTMEYDPNGQLAWMVQQLQAAELAGQNVWILGHMPMGSSSAFYDGSNYFQQIVDRYSATIAGMFFGHTHLDEFELSYRDYQDQSFENAIATSYICPSMTPTSGNPSFRVYTVDPVSYGVLDYTEYYTNLSAPNSQGDPIWEKYYSAKEAYGSLLENPITDPAIELTPAFWHNVTELFESNSDVFDQYYSRKTRGYNTANCNGTCAAQEICQLRAAEAQYNCIQPTPGVNLRKAKRSGVDAVVDPTNGDDCDMTIAGTLFSAMVSNQTLLSQAFSAITSDLE